DLDRALPLLDQAVHLAQHWQIRILVAHTASSLGYAYALAGRLREAVSLVEQAVEAATSMRYLADQSERVACLSQVCLLAGRTDDALESAKRALALAQDCTERGNEAWALRLLGEIAAYGDPPNVEQAENHYRQALALAEELRMR